MNKITIYNDYLISFPYNNNVEMTRYIIEICSQNYWSNVKKLTQKIKAIPFINDDNLKEKA